MKTCILILLAGLLGVSTLHAGFSERKLESTKRSATNSGKLIGFIFYEDFTAYKEQRDHDEASARNSACKKAIPRSKVTIIEINKTDKDLDKLPKCVALDGKTPRVVITDSLCTKVIVSFEGAPDREKMKALEKQIEEAVNEMRKLQDTQ